MRPRRVLGGHRRPTATTNPYLVQLTAALDAMPGLDYRTFTFPRALLWRYDVIHLHWPEVMMGGHRPTGRAVRQALTLLLVLRLATRRTRVVRTLHNLEPPRGATRTERFLLRRLDRRTDLFIMLNEHFAPEGRPHIVIPHGHYVEWFDRYPVAPPRAGRAVFVGLVRRYKGVEELVRSFVALDDPTLSLGIHGRPSSVELSDEVEAIARQDPRVTTDWRFLDDRELVEVVTGAQLVVLPYRSMYNSGVVIMALSLRRPVLVPRNPVTVDLGREVGPGWVHTFEGNLDAQALRAALAAGIPETGPDLSARGWAGAGEAHARAYQASGTP